MLKIILDIRCFRKRGPRQLFFVTGQDEVKARFLDINFNWWSNWYFDCLIKLFQFTPLVQVDTGHIVNQAITEYTGALTLC